MATRTWIAAALGVALVAACDVSQRTPQTAPPVTESTGGLVPGGTVSVARDASGTDAAHSSMTAGEKSIRLQGPGVNRARQIRV
jgi:uncharacterized lipoprotein YajG